MWRTVGLALLLLVSLARPVRSDGPTGGLTLTAVASGFRQVTTVAHAGDASGRLFVVERTGTIRIVTAAGQVLGEPFLDLTSQVLTHGLEQGLLGLVFHPDYADNGFFYVSYIDLGSDSVVARYSVSAVDPDVADPGSEAEVVTVFQPTTVHNVHELSFGPDGYLHVASGDGGPGGDPFGAAQNLSILHGKILRLDVDPSVYRTGYGIPADNPFVGIPGARDEIWAYGLRNPSNVAFDAATGDLYVADVGEALWEEVNYEPGSALGGRNYGWNAMEGTHCFDPPTGCSSAGLTLPAGEYPSVTGDCAVIGGHVYRGHSAPALNGWYLFADFCSGTLRTLVLGCEGWRMSVARPGTFRVSAVGEDDAGELLVAEWAEGATGVLYRVVAPSATAIFADGFESGTLEAWSECR